MSILNGILEERELGGLDSELQYIENCLEECRQQLNVLEERDNPMGFADEFSDEWKLFDEATRRLQIAKKALGLANKLPRPEERAKHRSIVIKLLNQLRGMLKKLTNKLTTEEQ